MKQLKGFALMAMLLSVMAVSVPRRAYAQQEVDPSWYDPSGSSSTTTAQTSHTQKVAKHQQKQVKSAKKSEAPTAQRTANLPTKRTATKARAS